jgi:hypothetical protein
MIFIIALTSLSSAETPPDYCIDFSPESCLRIKAVVESKVLPAYCAPGFALVGTTLTHEQLRICYVLTKEPLSPEEQAFSDRLEKKQNQIIEDARAMVKESWENYRIQIEMIEIGYKCDVIDKFPADATIQKIQSTMRYGLARAGLSGDPTMSVEDFAKEAIQAGKDAAEQGACTRLTAAERGRLRSMVSDLMR